MFIPRHPVIEDQYCSYGAQTGDATGVGGVICYAGSVLFLDDTAVNEEAIVFAYSSYNGTGYNKEPFGFAMQKVKTGYHQVHPTGFYMKGDLGSSDVIAQPSYSSGSINGTKAAPLGVAHLGIWDTVHYTCLNVSGTVADTNQMKPGQNLFIAANSSARVTNCATEANNTDNDGECINNGASNKAFIVGKVIKGASAALCTANIKNTTLTPIRIKLFV